MLEPSHPGNIGAAARAMKNMGLSQLCLVNPVKFPDVEATVRASGADDLLKNAQVVATIDEAIAECDCVLGTSARTRSLPWPLINPRESAQLLATQQFEKSAIIFGRENSGLTNEELSLCQYHIHIPTVDDFSSLNLASAIMLLCYELRMVSVANMNTSNDDSIVVTRDSKLASAAELEGYYDHLSKVMSQLGMLNPKQPKRLMQRMRRLYGRCHLESSEINILRGFLSAVEKDKK